MLVEVDSNTNDGDGTMIEALVQTVDCRRAELRSAFLHGGERKQCSDDVTLAKCDNCQEKMSGEEKE